MNTQTAQESTDLSSKIEGRLDDLEANLPTIPSKVLKLNRAMAQRAMSANRRGFKLVTDSAGSVVKAIDTGVRTVVGQTKAQTKIAGDTLVEEVEDLTDTATDRVEAAERSAEKRALREQTKDELYERAQELDIDGRATMTKSQLVDAISSR